LSSGAGRHRSFFADFPADWQNDFEKEGTMRPVTRLTTAIACAIALVGAWTANLAAQERLSATWPKSANAEAQALIDRGDQLLGEQSYSAARAEYEAAIELIRADDDFPSTALYRTAASYWHEGKPQTAAKLLDDLAGEAATFGDLVSQVWALADAAWIHGQVGHKIDMDVRVERLRQLLKSAYLPAEVRQEVVSKRLGEATTLIEQ